MHKSRELRVGACGAIAVCFTLILASLASPAGAQDGGGYGGTTTTTGEPTLVTCNINLTAGGPGTSVTATVNNVPFGATVRLLLDGTEMARATADLQAQSSGQPVLFGGQVLAAQATTTSVTIPWVVPLLPPGLYQVTVVGVDFTLLCNPEDGGMFQVLAAGAERSRGLDPSGGSLPRTGVYLGLLLAVALALVVAGRGALEASRRRRRQAARAASRAKSRRLAAVSESGERSTQ